MINSLVKSDCGQFSAKFDATKWFDRASKTEVVELARCGFSGDYGADEVARFMSDHDTKVAEFFRFLELVPRQPSGDTNGFECYVDVNDAKNWLEKHRPEWLDVFSEDYFDTH